jgi:CBS domain-containing protein
LRAIVPAKDGPVRGRRQHFQIDFRPTVAFGSGAVRDKGSILWDCVAYLSQWQSPQERSAPMAQRVRELMSEQPITLSNQSPIIEAARRMRAANIGAVIVEDGGRPCGIVTDRDIVVRAIADGRDPERTQLSEICSKDITVVSPDDDLDKAVRIMREKAVRRLLVVNDRNESVGILSIGDLALERDARSVLGNISAAPPNH